MGKITLLCKCGNIQQMDIDYEGDCTWDRLCDNCQLEKDKKEHDKQIKQRIYDAPKKLIKAGVPKGFSQIKYPPNRQVFEWIWKHKDENLLIKGETGTGKTTSICATLYGIMHYNDVNVRYYSDRAEFVDEWVRAKKQDNDNLISFKKRISAYDIIVIDELAGKSGEDKLSGPAQEALFDLIDGAYSNKRNTKIWFVGNIRPYTLRKMFYDYEPVNRRITESFSTYICKSY